MTEKELTKGAKRILDETEESADGMFWHRIFFGPILDAIARGK